VPTEFSYTFSVKIKDLLSDLAALTSVATTTEAALRKMGEAAAAVNLSALGKGLDLKTQTNELHALTQQLARLRQLQKDLAASRTRDVKSGEFTGGKSFIKVPDNLKSAFPDAEAFGVGKETIAQAIEAAKQPVKELEALMEAAGLKLLEGVNQAKILLREVAVSFGTLGSAGFEQSIQKILSGQTLQQAGNQRLIKLEERRLSISRQIADVNNLIERAGGGRFADRISKQAGKLTQDRDVAAERVRRAEQDVAKFAASGNTSRREGLLLAQKLTAELAKQQRIESDANANRGVARSLGALKEETGLGPPLAELEQSLQQVNEQIVEMQIGGPEAFKQMEAAAPGVTAAFQRLEVNARKQVVLQRILNTTADKASEKYQRLAAQLDRARQAQKQLSAAFGQFTNKIASSKDVQVLDPNKLKANLGFLEKTLVGAFDGFARRFQATLQFALSAAIIFGVQKLARELLSTAIEVERAFADIESALEFDIGFKRGTAEFASEVEDVRQGVLAAANDLNVLPTVANEIAFKMVARFRDIDSAIIATRAQMLALKISTIDSAEVLRALTAVAEGFAAATLVLNSDLSLQDRLLRQETEALKNYGRALDLATQIQQTWGVEVEDSLEGTARATEVFSQLGFSLEETMAIVAAVTVRLGQTGQVLAEKLVRSIGQITSPQIRDQLLDLAVASEALNLTFEDFDSGAGVLRKLLDQFDRIEQLEPDTANRLFQIIGQRREVEVVATVLGTRDIQDDIISAADNAAGAAERRFGFLRSTISEVLASLAVGFEEFAQNLAVLGTLGPFKLLLTTADELLQLLNKIAGVVIGFINALDKLVPIGDLGFGTFLATLATAIVSLTAIAKILKSIGTTNLLLGGGKAGLQAALGGAGRAAAVGGAVGLGAGNKRSASLVALQGLALVAKPVERALKNLAATFVNAGKRLFVQFQRLFGVRAINTATIQTETRARITGIATLSAANRASLIFFGKLLIFVAAAVWVGALVTGLINSHRALKEWTEALEESRRNVEREIIEEDITDPLEIAVRTTAAALENVENIADKESNLGDRLAAQFVDFADLSQQELKRRRKFFEPETDIIDEVVFATGTDDLVRRSLAPGTEEHFQINMADALRDSMVEAIEQQMVEATRLLTTTSIGQDPNAAEAISELQRSQLGVLKLLSDAGNQKEIDFAVAAAQEWENDFKRFERQWGISIGQTEESLNNLKARLKATQADSRLGRVSGTDTLAELDEIRIDAQREVDRRPEGEDRNKFIALVEQTNDAFQAKIRENFERKQAVIDLLETESAALTQKVDGLKGLIQQFNAEKNFKAAQDAFIEMIQTQRQLVDSLISTAQSNLALANALGSGIEDQIKAQQAYVDSLRAIFESQFPSGGTDEIRDFKRFVKDPEFADQVNQIQQGQAALNNLIDQAAVRRVVAEAKATGPVLSQLTNLTAQLAGARLKLEQATDGSIEAIEGLNEVNLTLANIAQNLLKAAQAYTLLQAGVNDSMFKLKAEITNVALELVLAKDQYDENSAEYRNLLLRQLELRNSLAQAVLSLRDLNRRLESDVTNAFEQAQLDLVAILEQLAAPDLGPLEKATLELEKKNAEAAAKGAFFDDKLFGLNFQFETGDIGLSQYINALRSLLETVDTTTDQGKKIWLEINGLIEGLEGDVADMQFNIPGSIRLPTLFEVRRSLAADQLGVNYQDNRTQLINLTIDDPLTLAEVLAAIEDAFGADVQRVTAGNVGVATAPF